MVIAILYFIIAMTVMAYFMQLKSKYDDITPEWQQWLYCGGLGLFWPVAALIILWMTLVPKESNDDL